VIVWAATTHLAKDLSGVDGDEGVVPLGSYIRRDFKRRAFALGFSAYSGSYAFAGQPVRQLSVAPGTSLESKAFAARDSDTVYLSLRELRKFGSIAARPLGSSFKTARWNEVLDGLLIFREEQAPEFPRRLKARRGSEQYPSTKSLIAWSYVHCPLTDVRVLRTADLACSRSGSARTRFGDFFFLRGFDMSGGLL
jgi:hypothetical protein